MDNYPKGIIIFKPNDNAPDFVKGSVVVTPEDFIAWCKENASASKDYKGKKQFKFDLKEGEKGLYLQLNTFEPKEKPVEKDFIF